MKRIYLLLLVICCSFSSFSQTGMLNGTGYAPNFTVTDINGNTDSAIAIVNVVDLINPIVVTQPITVILDQDGNASITSSDIDNGSSDNCNIVSRLLSKTSFDCSQIGDNIVILTVTDESTGAIHFL